MYIYPQPIEHLGNTAWDSNVRPIPEAEHECEPQTWLDHNDGHHYEKCRCGGTRIDESDWFDRNSLASSLGEDAMKPLIGPDHFYSEKDQTWLVDKNIVLKDPELIKIELEQLLGGMTIAESIRHAVKTPRGDRAYAENLPPTLEDRMKAQSIETLRVLLETGYPGVMVARQKSDMTEIETHAYPIHEEGICLIVVNLPFSNPERIEERCLPSESQP